MQKAKSRLTGTPQRPAHYVIFHPCRERYAVHGEATVAGRPDKSWAGDIWTDPHPNVPGGNEDPYVWRSPWLYSYCHATQLRREINAHRPFVRRGSYLFFCETDAAKNGRLKVDTVFFVAKARTWVNIGARVPVKFARLQTAGTGSVWLRHLRHGAGQGSGKHKGRYTYEAGINGASYLPMNRRGEPMSRQLESLLRGRRDDLKKCLPTRGTTYPLELTDVECARIRRWLEKSSHTRVTRVKNLAAGSSRSAKQLCK